MAKLTRPNTVKSSDGKRKVSSKGSATSRNGRSPKGKSKGSRKKTKKANSSNNMLIGVVSGVIIIAIVAAVLLIPKDSGKSQAKQDSKPETTVSTKKTVKGLPLKTRRSLYKEIVEQIPGIDAKVVEKYPKKEGTVSAKDMILLRTERKKANSYFDSLMSRAYSSVAKKHHVKTSQAKDAHNEGDMLGW